MTRLEKAEQARILSESGLIAADIAQEMGISRSYAADLLRDPDGSKSVARKRRYGRPCEVCGAITSGSNGRDKAPLRCKNCVDPGKFWTKKVIIEKIQEWDSRYGEQPKAMQWLYQVEGSPGQYVTGPRSKTPQRYWPTVAAVQREFGSWSNAVEAAGFTRREIGSYPRTAEWKQQVSNSLRRVDRDKLADLFHRGMSDEEMAAELGCATSTARLIRLQLGFKRPNNGSQSLLNRLAVELLFNPKDPAGG